MAIVFTALFYSQKTFIPKALAAGDEQITGFVYEDLNGNGSFDSGTETGADGIVVTLYDGALAVGSISTASGVFTFTSLNSDIGPGTSYTMIITPPSLIGYTFSQGSYSRTISSLGPNEHRDTGNSGIFHKNIFSGRTFYDANKDGIAQESEQPIHAGEVVLENSSHVVVAGPAAVTSGSYGISGDIIPAGNYYLHFTGLPTSYVFTDQNVGEDDTIDSDVGADAMIPVTVTYGTDYNNLDVGMYLANVLVGGRVFNDLNHNGTDEGSPGNEVGMDNVTIQAIDLGTSSILGTTTSDPEGAYQISYAPTLCAENMAWVEGATLSIACPILNTGGHYQLTFTTTHSCSLAGTQVELVAANEQVLYQNSCSEGGTLTDDTTYSLLIDTQEMGVGTAHLNFSNLDHPFIDGTMYNINLAYLNVALRFTTLPSGFQFTNADIGADDSIDSDVIDPSGYTAQIVAGPGDVLGNIDAGIYSSSGGGGGGGGCSSECGGLTIHIFTDNNGNGVQDSGEPDSATGATVTLALGAITQTGSPDSHGNLEATVAANTYTLTVNPPAGAVVTGVSNPTIFTVIVETSIDLGSRGIYFPPSHGPINGSGGGAIGSGILVEARGVLLYAPPLSDHQSDVKTESHPVVLNPRLPCLVLGGSSAQQFTDVQSNANVNFLSTIIIANNQSHLIHGYGDNNFGPHQSLTRFELLKVALASNCLGSSSSKPHPNTTFSDVPKDNSELSLVIGEAYAQGIIKGVDGKFFPNKPVSNAEMIKILLAASIYFPNGEPVSPLPPTISGIKDPTFAQYIEKAHQLGLFTLPAQKNFEQNKVVERIEMADLLAKFIKVIEANVAVK